MSDAKIVKFIYQPANSAKNYPNLYQDVTKL